MRDPSSVWTWALWPVLVEPWQTTLAMVGLVVGIVLPITLAWRGRVSSCAARLSVAWLLACISTAVLATLLVPILDAAAVARLWKYLLVGGAFVTGVGAGTKVAWRRPPPSARSLLWITSGSVLVVIFMYAAFGVRTAQRIRHPGHGDWSDYGELGLWMKDERGEDDPLGRAEDAVRLLLVDFEPEVRLLRREDDVAFGTVTFKGVHPFKWWATPSGIVGFVTDVHPDSRVGTPEDLFSGG